MALDLSDQVKVFGAGADVSDDPWTLQLKQAAMQAQANGMTDLCLDPYDALVSDLTQIGSFIQAAGKLDIPTWLAPIPQAADSPQVTKETMAAHVAGGGMLALTRQVQRFVRDSILPARPLLLGVDHSASGGTIAALAETLGPQNLSVLILDQHFDGLPLSLRLDPQLLAPPGAQGGGVGPSLGSQEDNEYCCGNFLKQLIDDGMVLPANLFLIGVADYPGPQHDNGWERYRDNYLDFEKRGCHFFPQTAFDGDYLAKLKSFVLDQITTSHVYVSLDVDVGAYQSVHAARYMDCMGIDRPAVMAVARIIAEGCRTGRFHLAGMDAMEFNMHFLGIEFEPGKNDATLSVALDFMTHLLSAGGLGGKE